MIKTNTTSKQTPSGGLSKIKSDISKESTYNPEFVAKINESRQQIKEGKVTRVKKENLSQFLGYY